MPYTIPSDTHAVNDTGHTADHNSIVDVLKGNNLASNVLNTAFAGGADPTGVTESTAAFAAALAALPTTTIWANPGSSSGASAVVHYGTILIPPGTYKLGATSDIGNIGPMVNLIGAGRNAVTLAYYGTGDCIRMFNPVRPSSDTFDTIAAWHGVINGFTIDGTNAGAGACGLHYGDTEGGVLGPDLFIKNFSSAPAGVPAGVGSAAVGSGGTFAAGTYFWVVTATTRTGESTRSGQTNATLVLNGSATITWTAAAGASGYNIYRGTSNGNENVLAGQVSGGGTTTFTDTGATITTTFPPPVNTSGATGLWLDNTVSWTENIWARVSVYNCGNCVMITQTTGDSSFEYNDLTFKVYGFPNQNGVVLVNGANYANGSMKVRANFALSAGTQTSAALAITGRAPSSGPFSQFSFSRLDVQAETDLSGANGPRTIAFGDTGGNAVYNCVGILSFSGTNWTLSNWSLAASFAAGNFFFTGQVSGDTNIAPNVHGATAFVGALIYGTSTLFTNGGMPLGQGDFLSCTLTQNMTVSFQNTTAGPQRKTIVITQAAAGGPFTVTWPHNASPTTTAPKVTWAGGTAPVMTATAGATDVYYLETIDGATWYGRAAQNVS